MIYVPSRAKRHKYKFHMEIGLNLVSLMDIFTILLLFLLIHVTGEGELIQIPEILRLPISISTTHPEPIITVYVTPKEIFVWNKKVADVRDVLNGTGLSIENLEKELLNRIESENRTTESNRKIIIMGDRIIPFTLLKRVMYSCAKAGYPAISLAVIQKE